MAILEQIKEMVEVDVEEDIFDVQLLAYINSGISYLRGNGIPVVTIEEETGFQAWPDVREEDRATILDWLHLRCLQRFDKSLLSGNGTTLSWIDDELTNLLYHLKAVYAVAP